VIVATAVATALAARAGIGDPLTDLRITQLDSGLTVATECVPGTLSVATGAWVAVGSRDEPEHLGGVSHFLEHLLFKGTSTRSAIEISRGVDRRGGDFNAFTTKEYTAYYCRLPARHASFAFELLGDILIRPALRDDDIDGERQVILEELAMDDDSPDDVAHRTFAAQLFHEHPLGRDPAGERVYIEAIGGRDVRSFFAANYRAEHMVAVAVGPLSHEEMFEGLRSNLVDLPTGGSPLTRSAPAHSGPGVRVAHPGEQVHVVVGGRGLARLDERREALDVVNHVLGGGLSSRLFETIREERGLAYSVYSGVSSFADAGAYQLYAGTMPHHAAEVEGLMREELIRLAAEGITDEELEVATGYLTGAFELGLEDNGARMARTAGQLVTTGSVRSVEDQVARWAAVDHDAVNDVIADLFSDEPITVTVGP
jgi:predicted Zn-dependent peptidase